MVRRFQSVLIASAALLYMTALPACDRRGPSRADGGAGAGGDAGTGGGGGGAGNTGAGGQGGSCPAPGSTSIYPSGACTGGSACVGLAITCDCVDSQWRRCRLVGCPTGAIGHPYACMSDVEKPPTCSCVNVTSPTQAVPYCVCSQTQADGG